MWEGHGSISTGALGAPNTGRLRRLPDAVKDGSMRRDELRGVGDTPTDEPVCGNADIIGSRSQFGVDRQCEVGERVGAWGVENGALDGRRGCQRIDKRQFEWRRGDGSCAIQRNVKRRDVLCARQRKLIGVVENRSARGNVTLRDPAREVVEDRCSDENGVRNCFYRNSTYQRDC